ncbi:MAG: S4 domain-containing protein [Gammaproteobacteria bacterium]
MGSEQPIRVRVDKWLWAARFFKTRALAAEAVNGGHVHINSERSKPAHAIKAGDVLKITRAGSTYIVTVVALAERRGNATAAQALYVESDESIARREHERELYRLHALANPRPQRRPDKRERRQLKAWRGRQ